MPHPGRSDDDRADEHARKPGDEDGADEHARKPGDDDRADERTRKPGDEAGADKHARKPHDEAGADEPARKPDDEAGQNEQLDPRRRQRRRWVDHGGGWGPRERWVADGGAELGPSTRWSGGAGSAGSAGNGATAPWEPRFRFSRWARLWLPVIFSFVVQVPGAVFTWRIRQFVTAADDDPARFAARIGLALLGPLALIAARRFPGPVVAVVSAAAGAYALLVAGEFAPPYIALAFAVVAAVVRGARIWAWWSLGVTWVVTVTLGILLGVDWQPAAVVAVTLVLVLLLGVGEGIRTRRARIDELRKRAAERRLTEVQAERVRIARELHDVLAHSLSQINVQAGVGLHLIDSQPEAAATALANIKETSKSALDEVRSVLGVLRAGQDAPGAAGEDVPLVPEPDLSRIDGLVASVVSQGLAVTLENGIASGADAAPRTSPPPKAVQLALYRIVQESLTNVVRHARARSAAVVLSETADAWTVSVVDDGIGTAGSTGDASRARAFASGSGSGSGLSSSSGSGSGSGEPRAGRGLLGMRERAALLGGHLEAGARPGGGFAVEAVIPRRSGSAPGSAATTAPTAASVPPATPPPPTPASRSAAPAPHDTTPTPEEPT